MPDPQIASGWRCWSDAALRSPASIGGLPAEQSACWNNVAWQRHGGDDQHRQQQRPVLAFMLCTDLLRRWCPLGGGSRTS